MRNFLKYLSTVSRILENNIIITMVNEIDKNTQYNIFLSTSVENNCFLFNLFLMLIFILNNIYTTRF